MPKTSNPGGDTVLQAPSAPHSTHASSAPQTQPSTRFIGSAPYELVLVPEDAGLCRNIAAELDQRLGLSAWTGEPVETGAERRVQLRLDRHHWLDLAGRLDRFLAGAPLSYFDRHDLLLIQRWQLAVLKWACAHPSDVDHRQARLRHFTRFGCALADLIHARGLSTEIRVAAAPPAAL